MKRLLAFVLLVVMLASTFALTSCELIKVQIDTSGLWGLIDKIVGKETSTEVRYTITQEEWNANIHMRNFTMVAGRGTYFKQTEQAVEVEGQMMVRKNGVDYLLSKDGYKWYGTPCDDFPVTYTLYERFEMDFKFTDLVYNEEYHSYDLEIYEDEIMSFSFENGVLVYITIIFDYESMTIGFKDVGTTVIDIPEFTIVEPTTAD